jgi:hypothetical protein
MRPARVQYDHGSDPVWDAELLRSREILGSYSSTLDRMALQDLNEAVAMDPGAFVELGSDRINS